MHHNELPITLLLSKSIHDRSLHICHSLYTQTVKHVAVLTLCLPMLNLCDILQK